MISAKTIESYVPLERREDLEKWWLTIIPKYRMTPYEIWTEQGPYALLEHVKSYSDESFT